MGFVLAISALKRKRQKDENDLLQRIREAQEEAKRLRLEAEAIKIASYDQRGQMAQETEEDKTKIKQVAQKAEDYVKKLAKLAGQNLVNHDGLDSNENDDLDLEDDEIAQKIEELFSTAPFKFKPRKREDIDKALSEHIDDMDIKVPVVWIKDQVYLIGSQKLDLTLERTCLMIK